MAHHIDVVLGAFRQDPTLAWVKTGIRLPSGLSAADAAAAVRTSPINTCVRKCCLEAIGGFPEGALYRYVGAEDMQVTVALYQYFRGAMVDAETVALGDRPESHLNVVAAMGRDAPAPDPQIKRLESARGEVIAIMDKRIASRLAARPWVLERYGGAGAQSLLAAAVNEATLV